MREQILKQKVFFIFLFLVSAMSSVYAQDIEIRESIAEGNRFFEKKDYQNARTEYAQALIKEPSSMKAQYNMGCTYYEMKEYEKAETYFLQAAKLSIEKKTKAKAFHNLGNSYLQQKKYKEAIESYKNSLRNNPSDNQTRYNLFLAKKLLNKKENRNPKDLPKPSEYAKAQKKKADEKARQGEFKSALGIMQESLKKDSTTAHFQSFINKLDEIIILDTLK